MKGVAAKAVLVVLALSMAGVMSGCTNWHQKYDALAAENANRNGLYERTRQERERLADQLAQEQAMIDSLQKQIASGKTTPDKVTGFEGTGGTVAFNAAAGTITVTLPDTILFDSGKVDLKKNTALGKILAVIDDKYKGKLIDVVGHTDTDPIKKTKWTDNWQLSTERALAVARYFMKNGIPEDEVEAVGRGPSMPIADNKTSVGKAKNRRVEIVVHLRSAEEKADKAAKKAKAVAEG
jgi:chemotaxis protein MotB